MYCMNTYHSHHCGPGVCNRALRTREKTALTPNLSPHFSYQQDNGTYDQGHNSHEGQAIKQHRA